MIMLAEIESLNAKDLKQMAKLIIVMEDLWFDQVKKSLSGIIQAVHVGTHFDERN
jgi:hypothetical protein